MPRTLPRPNRLSSALLLAALPWLAACASGMTGLTAAELRRHAAEHGVPAERVALPFTVDDEMRAWLATEVDERARFPQRLDQLLHALLADDHLAITYEAGYTGTAREVFASRHANCLGFTNLFVALAREAGVPVFFIAVDEMEDFEKEEDLVVVSRHITAGYGPSHELQVLEFSLGPDVDYKSVRKLSDVTAVALYYSNRGAELVRAGDARQAREVLRVATAIDPDLAIAWVNLGVARRRLGDLDGAEEAYRHALVLDPRTPSAYQNLASLLGTRGRGEEADELLARLTRVGSHNPYNFLTLGDRALVRGELGEAQRYYRRALRLDRDDPEPYAALGRWALETGDRTAAARWLQRAREHAADDDPVNPRVRELARRLAVSRPAQPAASSTVLAGDGGG